MIFEIPSRNLEKLNEKIEQLNKRARKLKVAEITTKLVSTQKKRVVVETYTDDNGEVKSTYTDEMFYGFEIMGESIKLDGGWTFVASLEHTPNGNIVRAIPNTLVPEEFRIVESGCDHCQTRRNRKDTYIVLSTEGRYKQVGHQCLKDYLGHRSAQAIALMAEIISELTGLTSMGEGYFGIVPAETLTEEFMNMAAEIILQEGFVSKSASEKTDGQLRPTSGKVFTHLYPSSELIRSGLIYKVSPEARELAQKATQWIKTEMDAGTDFGYNLKVSVQKETIRSRDSGILAAGIASYQKYMGELKTRETEAVISNYVGTKGKRSVMELTVTAVHHFDSLYGTRALYRMKDATGNVVIWWSSAGALNEGETYQLKGTVKEHSEYKGTKQTVLARCKVQEAKDQKTPPTNQ